MSPTEMVTAQILQAQVVYLKQELQTSQQQNCTLKQLLANLLHTHKVSNSTELKSIVHMLLQDIQVLSTHQLRVMSATNSTLDSLSNR